MGIDSQSLCGLCTSSVYRGWLLGSVACGQYYIGHESRVNGHKTDPESRIPSFLLLEDSTEMAAILNSGMQSRWDGESFWSIRGAQVGSHTMEAAEKLSEHLSIIRSVFPCSAHQPSRHRGGREGTDTGFQTRTPVCLPPACPA